MERYIIRCTEEQTKKALKLGAQIEVETIFASDHETSCDNKVLVSEHLAKSAPYQEYATIPTAEQMIGWLEEQGLRIDASWSWAKQITMWVWHKAERRHIYTSYGNSRKEATLAAINVALDYLIKIKLFN